MINKFSIFKVIALLVVVLGLVACRPVKTSTTKLKAIDKPFEKILVLEDGDEYLGDVLNKLRVEMLRQFHGRAELKFKRSKILSLDPDGELEQAITENKPDALLFVKFSNAVRASNGPNYGSILEVNYLFSLHRGDSREKVWEGKVFVKRDYGVETASQQTVASIVQKLIDDGMIRK